MGGGRGSVRGWGGVARVDLNKELKFFVKIPKNNRGGGRGGRVGVSDCGGKDGCERRSEVFRKNSKKKSGVGVRSGGGGGVRVNLNKELKFL